MVKRCIFSFLFLAMIFSLPACGSDSTFSDPNFEVAIREAIDKPKGAILTSDLERLTSLDALERSIADLNGLEYCTSLTNPAFK